MLTQAAATKVRIFKKKLWHKQTHQIKIGIE
jgi:hypothetical protein